MEKHFFSGHYGFNKMALLFLLLLPARSFSQHDSNIAVENFSRKNFVQLYAGIFSRSIRFVSTEKNDRRCHLRFSPNSSAFAGTSIFYKKIFLYFETSIPGTFKVNRKNDVRSFGLFAHYFKNKWGITGFVGSNRGLLMYMPERGMYGGRSDLKMFSSGVHFYRIFNGSRFSYIAANTLGKRQQKSCGSFMLQATPSFRQLYSAQGIIPDSLRQYHLNGNEEPSMRLTFFSIQLRPGYIHNFVWNKGKYFFSPALYAGMGTEFHSDIGSQKKNSGFNLSAGYRFKAVAGINGDKKYFSIEFLKDKTLSYLYKSNIHNSYMEASLNFGIRF